MDALLFGSVYWMPSVFACCLCVALVRLWLHEAGAGQSCWQGSLDQAFRGYIFCESCNGSLQQVTYEMVHGIALNVFLGDFGCCSLGHMGCRRCDREKLRTPILGIYAQYCRTFMSDHRVAAGPGMTHLFPIEQIELDKERLFPRFFEFVMAPGDPSSSVEVRELFGPLPEMLEQRIRARGAAQEKCNKSSVVETPGVEGVHEEEKTLCSFTAPGGLLQGLAQDGGESTGSEGPCAGLRHEVSDGMATDSHVFIGNDTWESEAGIVLG